MTNIDYPQVGRGWAFPPRWVRTVSGGVPRAQLVVNDGVEHLQDAMLLILRTEIGGRVMRPTFGAGVDRYVFEARTAAVCYRLSDDVRRALLLGEPRVMVDEVTATPADAADDRIDVTIVYRIDRHRPPTSMVVPFYLEAAR